MRVTTHDQVRAVLTGAEFEVPPVPAADRPGSVPWLRATVARFSTGPAHQRRRSLATAALAALDPARLRERAASRTAELVAAAVGQPVDLTPVARFVPAELLTDALGMGAGAAEAAITVARAYPPHAEAGAAADQAVAELVDACGGHADEPTAARIGLLAQAIDATAGLVTNAVLAIERRQPAGPPEAILAETLRHDPPVRVTRRRAAAEVRLGDAYLPAGTVVELDLAAANRDPDADAEGELSFGAGPHACPGAPYALAIAAGMVGTVRGSIRVSTHVSYEPSPTLRVPAALWVRAR